MVASTVPLAVTPCLLIGVRSGVCAVPLAHVVETMRPLPIEPVAGMAPFLLGLSVIRGTPVPVIDLGAVLGAGGDDVSRFVTLRVEQRRVALAVRSVVGFSELGAAEEMPPLLREASTDVVAAIGVLDARLLVVLRASRIVPEEIWRTLERREAPS